jgi:hypothetical protein
MQIGPRVLLLSMMNPVLAAEEAATLALGSVASFNAPPGIAFAPAAAAGRTSARYPYYDIVGFDAAYD